MDTEEKLIKILMEKTGLSRAEIDKIGDEVARFLVELAHSEVMG